MGTKLAAPRERSSTPKYRQIVSDVKNKIEKGILGYGHRLPSINDLSQDFQISRNTVEKAYIQLKKDGILEAVKGKGYFVRNTRPSKLKVMLLLSNLNDYTGITYNALSDHLRGTADVDLFLYHEELCLFANFLTEQTGAYNYCIVAPHFRDKDRVNVIEALAQIPAEKLIMLDRKPDYYQNYFGNIYQDFKMDIYNALQDNLDLAKKYRKLLLAVPASPLAYPLEIVNGFRTFCLLNDLPHDVIDEIDEHFGPVEGEAIITVSDSDLLQVIRKTRSMNFRLGKDYGVMAYNETPIKEIADLTVISTDFGEMGRVAAGMILAKEGGAVRNSFRILRRSSF